MARHSVSFTIFSLESCSLNTEVIELASTLITLGLDLTKLVLKGAAHLLQISLFVKVKLISNTKVRNVCGNYYHFT